MADKWQQPNDQMHFGLFSLPSVYFSDPVMTILHLLSQNQLTGAEVYACQLADQQVTQGHCVKYLA